MVNLKDTKIYKLFKLYFFTLEYFLLKIIGGKTKGYYFSKWVLDRGEEKMLVDYPLNSQSLVIDVGGYTGNFSDKIISIYNPNLFIFEPVKKYFDILTGKYSKNPKVKIYKYGLSDRNTQQNIYLSDDGTSLIKHTDKIEKVKLKDISDLIKKFKSIDLISINIEGAEYNVLERLTSTKLINRIKYLQVQFHDFVPNSNSLRKKIVKKILKTHKVRYSYPFVWESFELKK